MKSSENTPADEVRCGCGQLMGRIVEAGFEVKCKRCGRIQVIPWNKIQTS